MNVQNEIILLGTFHFDYVQGLIPNKQEEITELVNFLARYQPTKIAVELEQLEKTQINKDFKKYIKSGKLTSLNEIQQIAFRLARKLEHQSIFPVNWNGKIVEEDIDLLNKTIQEKYPEILKMVVSFEEKKIDVNEVTKITDSFKQINDNLYISDLEKMYLSFSLVTANDHNIGVDFLEKWIERELKIFKNTIELSSTHSDRILLLIGADHLWKLKRLFEGIGWKVINPFDKN